MLIINTQFILLSLSFHFFGPPQWTPPDSFEPQIQHIYIPAHRDLNQIFVEYELSNTCEKLDRVRLIPHDEHPQVLQILSAGVRTEGINCRTTKTRTIVPVDVRDLKAGRYELRNYHRLRQQFGRLEIDRDPTQPAQAFAPIKSLEIHEDDRGLRKLATLAGQFPTTCLALDADRVRVKKTSPQMIEILPFVKENENVPCDQNPTKFSVTVDISGDAPLASGSYFFHVRTADGNALTKLDRVTVDDGLISLDR